MATNSKIPTVLICCDDVERRFRAIRWLTPLQPIWHVEGADSESCRLRSKNLETNDVVVISWSLSFDNPVELCRTIKCRDGSPIVVIWGDPTIGELDGVVESGVDDILEDDVSQVNFCARLWYHFSMRKLFGKGITH